MNRADNITNIKNTNKFNIDYEKIPNHIAIIMDGNGRWARKHNLPRAIGHREGVNTLRDIIKTTSDLGVRHLTLYAFSTENWKRPKQEISALMKLLIEYLKKEIKDLHKNNVKINTIGNLTELPVIVQDEINRSKVLTKDNDGLHVNIALNYGGRDEITRTVKDIGNDLLAGKIDLQDINQDLISNRLDTKEIPEPDLLIRTGGEYRISNFLLWQCAYSEFWFTDIYWPDFTSQNLKMAIYDFQNRKRRFGGI